jgi:hypothetical protein
MVRKTLSKYYGDQMGKDAVDGFCVTYACDEKYLHNFAQNT